MKDSGKHVKMRIDGEEFLVPVLKKFENCDSSCKYWYGCHGPVRFLDCKENAIGASIAYNIVTGALIAGYTRTILFLNMGRIKFLIIMFGSLVFFDAWFSVLEVYVEKLSDELFYRKVKKAKAKKEKLEEAKIKAEEEKKALKEKEERIKNPNFNRVLEAEDFVKSLKMLADEFDFGQAEQKVQECCNKLFEIVNHLKKDSSGYGRVAFLFEAYLPEFYNTLKLYTDFVRADAVNKEYYEILAGCVDKFYSFLQEQKVEAIFDKKSAEIQFKSTAEALTRMIDKGE